MTDRVGALRMFIRVARSGSFSRAARELGAAQPTVSRAVAALEAEIGVALFTRSTRALTLTDAGAAYLERIEAVIDQLDEADLQVRGDGELRGVLRVGLSSSLANRIVIPALPRFADAHPALKIELLIDDRRHDLIVEGVDIALRFGTLPDSNAVARKIVSWRRIVAASPAYLERHGHPTQPADLGRHAAILIHSSTGGAAAWTFMRHGSPVTIQVPGRIMSTQNDGAIAAAVAGFGIVSTSLKSCRRELTTGQLVTLLPDWDAGTIDLHAVFTGGRATKASAKLFAAFLDDALAESDLRDDRSSTTNHGADPDETQREHRIGG